VRYSGPLNFRFLLDFSSTNMDTGKHEKIHPTVKQQC
jgi:hypothetical protein